MPVNLEKAQKLAIAAVDNMDMEGLIDYAVYKLSQHYQTLTEEEFQEEWDLYMGETNSDDQEVIEL